MPLPLTQAAIHTPHSRRAPKGRNGIWATGTPPTLTQVWLTSGLVRFTQERMSSICFCSKIGSHSLGSPGWLEPTPPPEDERGAEHAARTRSQLFLVTEVTR